MTTTEDKTPTPEQIAAWVTDLYAAVIDDMAHGLVATEVRDFTDIATDYLDANKYADQVGIPYGSDPRAGLNGYGTVNMVYGLVNDRLPLKTDETGLLRDLVIEGWTARMVRDLQDLGRDGKLTDPHARTLTGLGIPVPADLIAEGMEAGEGIEAVFLGVRAALPAGMGVLVDEDLCVEVLTQVSARLPLFAELDNAQVTALHKVVTAALATPGFIDPRCEDERPGLEYLRDRLGDIAAMEGRDPKFAPLTSDQVTDLYQVLEIAVQDPIDGYWADETAGPTLENLFALLERVSGS
jgi:hypothetical protein